MHSTSRSQISAKCTKFIFVDLDSALIAWRQINEGGSRCSEQDEVDTDRVDKVEDVDHAVALLDEEHEIAQDEQDQSNGTELGSVDESSHWGDGKN